MRILPLAVLLVLAGCNLVRSTDEVNLRAADEGFDLAATDADDVTPLDVGRDLRATDDINPGDTSSVSDLRATDVAPDLGSPLGPVVHISFDTISATEFQAEPLGRCRWGEAPSTVTGVRGLAGWFRQGPFCHLVDVDVKLDEGTLAMWVNAAEVTGTRTLYSIASNETSSQHISLFLEQGFPRLVISGSESPDVMITSSKRLETQQWAHVAMVWGDGMIRLYIDGERVAAVTFDLVLSDNPETPVLGADSRLRDTGALLPISAEMNGFLDEFYVFDFAMSTGEILDLRDASGQ